MIKKYKPYIIFFYAFCAVSLIFSSFFDLKIDILLNNPENPFALWLRNTGEIPCRLICPIAGSVLFFTNKKLYQKALSLIIELFGSAYLGYYIGKYFFLEENRMIFSITFGIGIGIIFLISASLIKIPKEYIDILRKIAVMSIIIMFLQLLTVEVLKEVWGRVRFRDLIIDGNYDRFTNWYITNGVNGNKSFPSGHTAGAGMSYIMMFLPFVSKKYDEKKSWCFLIPFVYTSLVAYSRLIMGAHYLSDVTAGGIISFTIVIIFIAVFDKKYYSKNILIK